MSVSQAEGELLVAIVTSLIAITPVATAVIITYLRSLENRRRIDEKPSANDVSTLIDKKISEIGNNNTTNAESNKTT